MARGKQKLDFCNFEAEIVAGALADQAVIADEGIPMPASGGDLWLVGGKATFAMRNHTAGEGPLIVGMNDGDYTAAEIAECYVARDAEGWEVNDRIQRERASRSVRHLVTFPGLATDEVIDNGKLVKFKLAMRCNLLDAAAAANFLAAHVFNDSGAALTTGSVINVRGTLWGRRIKGR